MKNKKCNLPKGLMSHNDCSVSWMVKITHDHTLTKTWYVTILTPAIIEYFQGKLYSIDLVEFWHKKGIKWEFEAEISWMNLSKYSSRVITRWLSQPLTNEYDNTNWLSIDEILEMIRKEDQRVKEKSHFISATTRLPSTTEEAILNAYADLKASLEWD